MRLLFIFFLCSFSFTALAQEYLEQPICFTIKNNAPYGVYGDVQTDIDVYKGPQKNYTDNEITHTATFRLKEGEDVPVCTTGPMFPDNKVRLTIRTLVPVFECYTYVYPGAEIKIQGRRKADDSGVETWAECL